MAETILIIVIVALALIATVSALWRQAAGPGKGCAYGENCPARSGRCDPSTQCPSVGKGGDRAPRIES